MTRTELHRLLDGMAPVIKTFVTTAIAKAVEPLQTENANLAARVKQLESRPVGVKYCGTFQRGSAYAEHDAVTHGGSVWIARRATASDPGAGDSGWQLAVKAGRDAVKGAA